MDSSSSIDEVDYDIEILETENKSDANTENAGSSSNTGNESKSGTSSSSITGEVIRLGSASGSSEDSFASDLSSDSSITDSSIFNSDSNKGSSIIYKSKSEYIKEYAIYGFSLLCIGLIILLLMDKK